MTGAPAVIGVLLSASVAGTSVFAFADPDITESSGLVDLGSLMVTTNDSGGDPLVFVVDASGRTVGRTTFADEVTDVEALAPAGDGAVWVGDIGDNRELRSRVQVYRVDVGRGDRVVDAPAYDLVYPDGPHDAESLVYGRDGRLRIVTKSVLGGQVYTAPEVLDADRPNRLRAGPTVPLWATDAALFPDGRHVIVRGYGSAMIANYPSFTPVGPTSYVDLPDQEQGEGVSVGREGRIRLSSEGAHSRVVQIRLPAEIRDALLAPTSASGSPLTDRAQAPAGSGSAWPWVLGGVLAVAGFAFVVTRRRGSP